MFVRGKRLRARVVTAKVIAHNKETGEEEEESINESIEEDIDSDFEAPAAAKRHSIGVPIGARRNKKTKTTPRAKKKSSDKRVILETEEKQIMRARLAIARCVSFRPPTSWRPLSSLRVGYPCMNRHLGLSGGHNFRMANHSVPRLIETVQLNLDAIEKMLHWNVEKGLLFFRIGSEVIPFASHKNFRDVFDWRSHFAPQLSRIGDYIKQNRMRISMHPDQFVLLNSPKEDIVERSVAELEYQASFLDSLGLDYSAKLQIHVGGVYGNKEEAMNRFLQSYRSLSRAVSRRLVIENDDRLYSLKDCLELSRQTGVPILFDNLHHECLHNGESLVDALRAAASTWKLDRDGLPLLDYSSQDVNGRKGKHAESIDLVHWHVYVTALAEAQMQGDVMLEIKDKEKSALLALTHLKTLERVSK